MLLFCKANTKRGTSGVPWHNATREKYWVGHKVRLGFSIRSYRKPQMNFLANPIVKKSKDTKANKTPQFLKIFLNLLRSKNTMHSSLVRILFRCDLSNILRYVSIVFAKEHVECSFSLQWNMFLWSLKLVFLVLFHKQAVVARMHHWNPSGSQPHMLESSTIFLLREAHGLA